MQRIAFIPGLCGRVNCLVKAFKATKQDIPVSLPDLYSNRIAYTHFICTFATTVKIRSFTDYLEANEGKARCWPSFINITETVKKNGFWGTLERNEVFVCILSCV